jgi:SAM-dependent methyltransferase
MVRDDATRRFSSRVDNYVRYRPRYPEAILGVLERECGLTAASVIADVGSGTGMLAELFLRLGCRVIGVEPNREMRQAGDGQLAGFPAFSSVEATAEVTTLPAASVDFVTAGQAFHWFDRARARAEFARILVPGGTVVLVWNKRRRTGTPFLAAYEAMLQRFSIDYGEVDHDRVTPDVIAEFFRPNAFTEHTMPNHQVLDLVALRGRLESSSYAPPPGHPNHAPMLVELDRLFAAHSADGVIALESDTVLYHGRLG